MYGLQIEVDFLMDYQSPKRSLMHLAGTGVTTDVAPRTLHLQFSISELTSYLSSDLGGGISINFRIMFVCDTIC